VYIIAVDTESMVSASTSWKTQ